MMWTWVWVWCVSRTVQREVDVLQLLAVVAHGEAVGGSGGQQLEGPGRSQPVQQLIGKGGERDKRAGVSGTSQQS